MSLLSLNDDMYYELITYLSIHDIHSLKQTCNYFNNIVKKERNHKIIIKQKELLYHDSNNYNLVTTILNGGNLYFIEYFESKGASDWVGSLRASVKIGDLKLVIKYFELFESCNKNIIYTLRNHFLSINHYRLDYNMISDEIFSEMNHDESFYLHLITLAAKYNHKHVINYIIDNYLVKLEISMKKIIKNILDGCCFEISKFYLNRYTIKSRILIYNIDLAFDKNKYSYVEKLVTKYKPKFRFRRKCRLAVGLNDDNYLSYLEEPVFNKNIIFNDYHPLLKLLRTASFQGHNHIIIYILDKFFSIDKKFHKGIGKAYLAIISSINVLNDVSTFELYLNHYIKLDRENRLLDKAWQDLILQNLKRKNIAKFEIIFELYIKYNETFLDNFEFIIDNIITRGLKSLLELIYSRFPALIIIYLDDYRQLAKKIGHLDIYDWLLNIKIN